MNIRFAVIGLGHIGKRHAALIEALPECELVALCDLRSREELGLADHGAPFFPSLEALLTAKLPLDVVCIATPNGLHAPQAIAALRAGYHVVIEKPMALTKADCEAIIYEALHRARQVFCVMQNRYSPPAAWLREVVREGVLGRLYLAQANCFWNRDDRYYGRDDWHGTAELDGGTLFTQFSHFVDLLYWVFGDMTDLQARFHDFAHQHSTAFEDSGTVQFRFVNGGMGALAYSTAVWDRNLESSLTVVGEHGSIKLAGQYMNELAYCHLRDYAPPTLSPAAPANDYGGYTGSAANHRFVFENVVDVLKGRSPITVNAMEGLKVVEIIERIYGLR